MARILSLSGLRTLQAAREAERDERLTVERKLAARRGRNRDRLLAWQRSSDLDARAALAEALIDAAKAADQSIATSERIRRHD